MIKIMPVDKKLLKSSRVRKYFKHMNNIMNREIKERNIINFTQAWDVAYIVAFPALLSGAGMIEYKANLNINPYKRYCREIKFKGE